MFFLTGCGMTIAGDQGFSVPKYTQEQRRGVVTELKSCEASYVIEFLKDYKILRDQVRVK